ncbi:hypothetical protein FB451DRAFT_1390994 [Mycena latifolia]|nr:hypothetical protein FB451DRAFT_1390994 [Mycena latifolia]
MAARSVLHVQELCDCIVDFIHNSPGDLKSCALVSPRLASSAQYHLFHEVRFGNGIKWNDAGACQRFCAVLKTSSHLAPLIHRIRACFTPDVLSRLCEVEFPNLHDLVLFRPLRDNLVANAIPQAARLIGTPSLRYLKLQDLVLGHIDNVAQLFQHRTHAMESLALSHISVSKPSETFTPDYHNARLKIKTLSFDSIMSGNSHLWLLHPQIPFDFSALEDLDLGGSLSSSCLSLLEHSRLSICKLRIYARTLLLPSSPFCSFNNKQYHAEDAVNPKYTNSPIPFTVMTRLPVLTHLTIGSLGEELQDVETLLEGLPPTNCLARLTIDIMTRPREDGLRQLGVACASMGMGCTVEVHLWRFMSRGMSTGDMTDVVCTAFVELDERGSLVVRVDGVFGPD